MLRGVVVGQEGCKSKVVVGLARGFFTEESFLNLGWRGFESAFDRVPSENAFVSIAENICIFHFSFNFGAVVARCTYPFCTPGLARASTLVCHIPIFQNIKTKQEAK
jgi:hypothetical protein